MHNSDLWHTQLEFFNRKHRYGEDHKEDFRTLRSELREARAAVQESPAELVPSFDGWAVHFDTLTRYTSVRGKWATGFRAGALGDLDDCSEQ